MKNPFAQDYPALTPEEEAATAGLLAPLGEVAPSDDAVSRIRGTMANALSATFAARPSSTAMRRVAFTSAAVTAPLMAVSAVGAITGNEPLAGPINFVSDAVGITSAETPVANEAADETPVASPSSSASPSASPSSSASPSATPTGSATPEAGGAGGEAGATGAGAAAAAHSNGKGCDDVNPAVMGTPTPGGPVDCEVGNSGDHRQNGKNKGGEATPTGTASPEATETPDDEDEDEDEDDSNGGVSRGLGLGHEKGNGNGHEKHEHEPNENGKGPKTATAEPTAGGTETPTAGSAQAGPGNSGGNSNSGQGSSNSNKGGSKK